MKLENLSIETLNYKRYETKQKIEDLYKALSYIPKNSILGITSLTFSIKYYERMLNKIENEINIRSQSPA